MPKRTTISIDAELYKQAKKRAATMKPPKSFTAYVEQLIAIDVQEAPTYRVIREQPGNYAERNGPR